MLVLLTIGVKRFRIGSHYREDTLSPRSRGGPGRLEPPCGRAAGGCRRPSADGRRPSADGRRPRPGPDSPELLRHRRRRRQHRHADRPRGRDPRGLGFDRNGGQGPGDDPPGDVAADPLHHQHEHGPRSRRWERQARQGGAQHPPGRCRGRRGVERRPGLQLGQGQRAGTRKRADQDDGLNGSAGPPVRALAHEDIRLQAVLDVPERRRHSGDSHARGAHRWRHDRVLPPWRCDCDGRHHRHDPLARHRHQARRHRPGRARCTEPPDGS